MRGGLGDDHFLLGTTGTASASTAVARGQEGDDSFIVRNFVGYLDGGLGTDSLDLDLRRMAGGVVRDLRSIAITGGGTYHAGGIAGVIRGFEEFRIRTSDGNDKVLLGDVGLWVETRRGAETGTYGDSLDLSLIDANPFMPEDDAFITVDALTGQAGQADILDSGLAWDLDLDGDGAADLTLQFSSEALFLVIL